MTNKLLTLVRYFFFLFFTLYLTNSSGAPLARQEVHEQEEQLDEHYSKALSYRSREPLRALASLDSAIAHVKVTTPVLDAVKLWHLKGAIYLQQEDFPAAVISYQQGLDLAQKREDAQLTFVSALEIADIYEITDDYTMVEEYLNICMRHLPEITEPLLKAKALRAHARVAEGKKDIKEALSDWMIVEQLSLQAGNYAGAIEAEVHLGQLLLQNNQLDQAMVAFQLALAGANRLGDTTSQARLHRHIADCHIKLKDESKANAHLQQAYRLLDNTSLYNERVEILMSRARLAINAERIQEAESLLEEANLLAQRNLDQAQEARIHRMLAGLYEVSGDHARALHHYQLQADLSTALQQEQSAQEMSSLKSYFALERKQQEIEYLRKEKELFKAQADISRIEAYSSRVVLAMFGLMMVLLSILALMFRRRTRARKNAKHQLDSYVEEIHSKNHEIERQHTLIEEKNNKLAKAHETIAIQNKKLRNTNERLEEMVNERTEELIKAYKKLSIHTNHAPLAVIEWNRNLELIRWSRQAEKMFGYSSDEVLGRSYEELEFIFEDDRLDQDTVMESLTQGKIKYNFSKVRNYTKDKSLLHVEWSNSTLYDKDGKIDAILSIANDVSDREKAMTELKIINKELDDFIYKASHDLQGPVARMQGVINLGIIECEEQVAQRYFKMLGNVTGEMSDLLSKLQRVHTIYEQEPVLEEVNVHSEIMQVTNRFIEQPAAMEMEIYVEADPSLRWHLDPKLFELIVENMTDNALLYREKRGAFLIFRVERMVSGMLKICVIDNGIGIPQQSADRIFDIFYQGTPKSISNGLGLYLVKKAIERMGGSIRLINPAKDTIFEIILPTY